MRDVTWQHSVEGEGTTDEDAYLVEDVETGEAVAEVYAGDISDPEELVRLVTAAPDLLKALKPALDYLKGMWSVGRDPMSDLSKTIRAAEDAIAKTERRT